MRFRGNREKKVVKKPKDQFDSNRRVEDLYKWKEKKEKKLKNLQK